MPGTAGGPRAARAAVSDILDKLAQGKARILRTQPDPRGKGPLFELYHDALARPVLSWLQEARVKAAERRLLHMSNLYDRARRQQEQAQLQEARAVSASARQAIERGDAMTGILAALAVLPRDLQKPDRAVSNVAAATLLDAWLRNRETVVLIGHQGAVNCLAFSPDGRWVVTGSDDNTARFWDVSSATLAFPPLEGHRKGVTSVAFSADGRRVATGSDDNTARVWDVSGAPSTFLPLEGHRGRVSSVAFSPDGNSVVTGSWDNTAMVWDLSAAIPHTVIRGHRRRITGVTFSRTGGG